MSERAAILFDLADASVLASTRGIPATILRAVNLTVHERERIAILGANGAGKSTLLRAMHGLLAASDGRAAILPPTEQAMILQRPVLLKRSAIENVAFALRARGATRESALARAREALAACGIDALADRYARSLSGGEQQQLALARARALAPRALLADEPTSSLAPAAVHAVEKILLAMSEEGATLVFSTHNRGQAKRLATRVIFMYDGRIVEDRSTEAFFSDPQSPEAIEYLSVERA